MALSPLSCLPMAEEDIKLPPIKNGEKVKSVFVVVNPYCGSYSGVLYQFKIQQGGQVSGGVVEDDSTIPLLYPDYIFFKDNENQRIPASLLDGAYFCSSSKLYVMLHADQTPSSSTIHLPKPTSHSVNGIVFDTKTGSIGSFSPPIEHKSYGPLIYAYEKLYYIANPTSFPHIPNTTFECYDPITDSWESLPSLPFYGNCFKQMDIHGYAVCHDCILFSLEINYTYKFMVFHINTKQWHKVDACVVPDDPMSDEYPFPFQGRAVVVGDTIYAIAYYPVQIVAFSLRTESEDNDRLSYFIDTPILLPGLDPVSPPSPFCTMVSNFMVSLGNLEFYLVQTGFNYKSISRQHLSITTFRIVRGDGNLDYIKTLHSTVLDMHLPSGMKSYFVTSFTPDYDDTENEEEKSLISVKLAKQECVCASSDAMEENSRLPDEEIETKGEVNAKKKLKSEGNSVEWEMHPSPINSVF